MKCNLVDLWVTFGHRRVLLLQLLGHFRCCCCSCWGISAAAAVFCHDLWAVGHIDLLVAIDLASNENWFPPASPPFSPPPSYSFFYTLFLAYLEFSLIFFSTTIYIFTLIFLNRFWLLIHSFATFLQFSILYNYISFQFSLLCVSIPYSFLHFFLHLFTFFHFLLALLISFIFF